MSKKRRTPPPPRPVQAPKRRVEPPKQRRTRMWLAALAGVALLAAAVVGIAMAVSNRNDASLVTGPCTAQTYPSQGRGHVLKLKKGFEYNSFPATTGPHYPSPAVWSEYSQPIDQIFLVHNLEHGGVIVQYGSDVSENAVRQIVAWYRDDPNAIIVAPLPDVPEAEPLRDKITLAAWPAKFENQGTAQQRLVESHGVLAVCTGFDDAAFSDFRDDYRGNGPEPFKVEDLLPGKQ